MLFYTILVAAVALARCDNLYTVTEEAWFEVKVEDMDGPGQDYTGRFTIALFGEAAPMTVLNFISITKGYKQRETSLAYKGSIVHRIVRDFVIQMGDVTKGDGTGGRSIFGERFTDEEFLLSHRSAGWVSARVIDTCKTITRCMELSFRKS